MNATVTVLTSLSLAVVCGCGVRAVPLDSDATFAMHQENRTFVMDRPRSGAPAVVTAAEWLRLPGDPAWALRRNEQTRAAYWIDGNAGTTARAGLRSSDRPLGDVRPTWDDNAIRLHIEPSGGQPVVSDVFAATENGGGPAVLTRDTQTILDVRGRYQAALRDATGVQVGWMRLRIGPYQPAAADLRSQAARGRERRPRGRCRDLARQRDRLDRGAHAERVPEGQGAAHPIRSDALTRERRAVRSQRPAPRWLPPRPPEFPR